MYGEDFGKGGGVLAFEGPFANLAGAEVEGGVDGVEERRLADAAMTAEEADLASD